MATEYDMAVIGGGPGGYIAAIRAAQLGMKTACIEQRASLGGTCLNVGCIPSKAMLHSSHLYEQAGHDLAGHGVNVGKVSLDLAALLGRKDKVVGDSTRGIEYLFRKHKIAWLKGAARLLGGGKLEVAGDGKTDTVAAKHIIIATGSDAAALPGVTIDEKRIVTSTGGLKLENVPRTLAVIGAGYIGLELGTVWRRLGAEVTVIEFLDRILPGMDSEVAKQMQRILAKQGLKFMLATKVAAAASGPEGVKLQLEPADGKGEGKSLTADVVLVATGRKPRTQGLGLEQAGVNVDEKGRIVTNGDYATNAPGIYAVGDVIAGPMLAHKAMDEGVACVEIIAGQKPHIDYNAIPAVVYTWPEAATVGLTEDELKVRGAAYNVGKHPFSATPRARVSGDTDGFVKILADAKTDRILGCHIIGPNAGDLIHELSLAMEFGASAEDIARACHAHPTLAEAIKEAALAVANRALHI